MDVQIVDWSHAADLVPGDELVSAAGNSRQPVLVSSDELRNGAHLTPGLGRRIDRFTSLALLSVDRLQTSILKEIASERVGVFVANVYAGWWYGQKQLQNLVELGPAAVHAFQATAWFPAAAQGEISIKHGWKGAGKTFSGRSSAAGDTLFAAVLAMYRSRIDAAVVVFAESCLSEFLVWGAGLDSDLPLRTESAIAMLLLPGTTWRSVLHTSRIVSIDMQAQCGRPLQYTSQPVVTILTLCDDLESFMARRISQLSLPLGARGELSVVGKE